MILYFLKLNTSIAILFLVYHFVVRVEKNFNLSRSFLLVGLAASLLLPLMGLISFGSSGQIISYTLPGINVFSSAMDTTKTNVEANQLINLYYLISAGFSIFLLLGFYRVFDVLNKAEKQVMLGKTVWVVSIENVHFTFLNRIVVSKNTPQEALPYILSHEETHKNQFHTIDLLLIEVVKVFLWYNPFVWWYKKAMVENHEFLADEQASKINQIEYKNWLINNALQSLSPVLVNQFLNQSLIKNRIKMLQKQTNNKVSKLAKAAAFMGIISMLIIACSNDEITPVEAVENAAKTEQLLNANEVDKLAEFPGGMESLIAFFQENLKYPEAAKEAGTEGKVFIAFVVSESGSLSDFEVVKSASEELDAAALEIIKAMPNWTPAEKGGKPVAMKMTLPVNYALN